MKRVGVITALSMLLVALSASPALAQVDPGTYTPDPGSFNSANAPGSSHVKSGTVQCVVDDPSLDVDCDAYVLGGVGNTNADVSLVANYTAIVDCNNPGKNKNNPIESHTTDFESESSATVESSRNGQLRVPAQSASAGDVEQVCPNHELGARDPRWVPSTLVSFTYTLTFADFTSRPTSRSASRSR